MSNYVDNDPFIDHLFMLRDRQSLGAMAALRRGLGKSVSEVPDMYPYIVPHLPDHLNIWDEQAYYLVASLFAMHPLAGGQGNLGSTLREIDDQTDSRESDGPTSIERRFLAILKSSKEALPEHLRQAVSLAASKEIPVDWNRLLRDLKKWGRDEKAVQKSWAYSYWKKEEE